MGSNAFPRGKRLGDPGHQGSRLKASEGAVGVVIGLVPSFLEFHERRSDISDLGRDCGTAR